MLALGIVRDFIDRASNVERAKDLHDLLDAATRELGFDYFALVHHVDLSSYRRSLRHMDDGGLVALTNYPEIWVEKYIEERMVAHDPVLLASHRSIIGFDWEDIPRFIAVTQSHCSIRERTQRAGIDGGFTVPAHLPGEANGSCNFAMRRGRRLPCQNLEMAQLLGAFAFQAARALVVNSRPTQRSQPPALTPRQLECLRFVARGKSDQEIGIILGISPGTVSRHIEQARQRYDVVSRMQVVMRVMFDGQLDLADTLR